MEDLVDGASTPIARNGPARALKHRDYQLDTYIGCLKLFFTYNDRKAFSGAWSS